MSTPKVKWIADGSAHAFEQQFPVDKQPTVQEFADGIATRCAAGSKAIVYRSQTAFQVQLAQGGSEQYGIKIVQPA